MTNIMTNLIYENKISFAFNETSQIPAKRDKQRSNWIDTQIDRLKAIASDKFKIIKIFNLREIAKKVYLNR